MAVERLSQASILTLNKYSSMMAGSIFVNGYELINTQVLSSAAASVTFSSLPTVYSHLQIRYSARGDAGVSNTTFLVRFNGDTATNYSQHWFYGNNAAVTYGTGSAQTGIGLITYAANSATASHFTGGVVTIPNYQSTTNNKTLQVSTVTQSTGGPIMVAGQGGGAWYSTAAVTSLTLVSGTGNFNTNSRFSLYGIKG
jgi:hypothetical protein